jgi:hypothetical protein
MKNNSRRREEEKGGMESKERKGLEMDKSLSWNCAGALL